MLFYVAVKSVQQARWTILYRLHTLVEALAAYRSVEVGAGGAKALMQRHRDGWHVLAHAAGGLAEVGTEQAWTEGREQARVTPLPG
jgi:hypothetical protein